MPQHREGATGLSIDSLHDFMIGLTYLRETGEKIIESVHTDTIPSTEVFRSLAVNMAAIEDSIEKSRFTLDKKIEDLNRQLQEEVNQETFEREQKRLEFKKRKTFYALMTKELKRQEHEKQKAMEVFLEHCVKNGVEPESPSQNN